uniref:hypothetical protein n=1 Tax=Flavobacterium sp. TaxID=239 RepID=UPI0040492FB8
MKKIIATFLVLFLALSFAYSQEVWDVKIKDSTQYDIEFLNYWKHVKPYALKITNDSIIVNKEYNDPILIPKDLPLNQAIYYELKSKDTLYQMTVKRVNFTNIEYTIIGKAKNETFFSRQGIAILKPTFHLGSEGVYEKSEDEFYGMNDYNITSNGLDEMKLLIPTGTVEISDYIEQQGENKIYLSFNKLGKE